jgi:tRNA(fMet)-specific endonuclease VapC
MTSGDKLPAQHLALDTSAYSHLRRSHPTVLEWVARADVVEVSLTVVGELEAAFRLGSRYRENTRSLNDFLPEPFVRATATTRETARRYGEIFAQLRRAGTPVPVNDIWIAASAMESGAHLVTFDSDFQRIELLDSSLLV